MCYNDGDDYDSNHLALDESYFFNLLPLDQFSVEFARDIIHCILNKYKQTTIFALFLKKKMAKYNCCDIIVICFYFIRIYKTLVFIFMNRQTIPFERFNNFVLEVKCLYYVYANMNW